MGAAMDDGQEWVRLQREFDAPIHTVWRMWTDSDLFRRWYGPKGMTVPVAEMDLVVGGTRKICMEMATPERVMSMWFIGVYKEISPPVRLVYTESMCDADGVLIPPQSMGMPEGTPDVTEVVVDLEEIDGGTRMTLRHIGVPEASAGRGGWIQAIDKLSDILGGAA